MDLFAELENMAANVDESDIDLDSQPEFETIKRWQHLFHYTHTEAVEHIVNHRGNLSRVRVSDEHWEMVSSGKEAEGYDREAYEYSMNLGMIKKRLDTRRGQKALTFLFKLEGPLHTAAKVQEAAGLALAPVVIPGIGDSGEAANFCRVDGAAKEAILNSISNIAFRPTFLRISKAEKALSNTSIYPTLGIDSTLPQHRPANIDLASTFSPSQNQYPVWYFFYGTLADPDVLSRLLYLSGKPELRPASIIGGIVRTWAGKYKALVDAPASISSRVDGWAYRVASQEHEDALGHYETDMYEVVRCLVTMKDRAGEETVNGLTFRFVGNLQDLI